MVLPTSTVSLLLSLLLFSNSLALREAGSVPALFIFGDSIVDCGNNNYFVNSSARADFAPYGVDFYAVTGRFTNARTIADVIAELLGLPLVPCFRDPNTTGKAILKGVNYASAGSGILDSTNSSTIVTSLRLQIELFAEKTLPYLQYQIGENTSSFLSQSIFLFNTGGNDFMDHCFGDTPCELPAFVEVLLDKYADAVKLMYSLGARKFLLFSTEVSGCTPFARARNNGSCVWLYNYASTLLNNQLNLSIDKFEEEMPGSHFVFVNLFEIMGEVMDDAASYGIEDITASCCETVTGRSGCVVNGSVCGDRSKYLFFDGGHPSDVTNSIFAKKAYASNLTSQAYPFSVQHLANLATSPTVQYSSLISKPWNLKRPDDKDEFYNYI